MSGVDLKMVELIDDAIGKLEEMKKGSVHTPDDVIGVLSRLRRKMCASPVPPASTGVKLPMRRTWTDSVLLYKWAQSKLPRASIPQIHNWLMKKKEACPVEYQECNLATAPKTFEAYVRKGLKCQGMSHRQRKAKSV